MFAPRSLVGTFVKFGGGSFSREVYTSNVSNRASRGESAFHYSDVTGTKPRAEQKVHESLDPKKVNSVGWKGRESRDSAEHPESLPVMVIFDETGSMAGVPVVLQTKLADVMGLLVGKFNLPDSQVLFGAIGDAHNGEKAPLQIGQFEASNAMEHDLGNIFLERMGGGTMEESYDLALYFAANHVVTDAWDKRGKKGYLFLIGDERGYPYVDKGLVKHVIDDDIQADIPFADVMAQVLEKWDVFFLIPARASHGADASVLNFWTGHLGQRAIALQDESAVAEVIAGIIGLCEGVDLHEVTTALAEAGGSASASSALVAVAGTATNPGAAIATVDGNLPETADSGAARL